MADRAADNPWLPSLLELLHQLQWQGLRVLHTLGLAGEVDGQPAWPWPQRISGEHLLLDVAQARLLLVCAGVAAAAVVALLIAWRWRHSRIVLLPGALLALWLAPWPSANVLLQAARPQSFHTQPLAFTDTAIVRGQTHYQQHCLRCHGTQGKGHGPDAAVQPVWPPNFASPLLWSRADGDLFAAVRHGMQDRRGQPTMPGFAQQLSVEQTWEVLHFLRAQAAGALLQATGNWVQPVKLPALDLRCHDARKRSVADWPGQRLRLAVTDAPQTLLPDPRLVTLWLPTMASPEQALPAQVDCMPTSPATAHQALALVTGGPQVQDMQVLSDRAGWLRALNGRGADSWSDDDLLCRTASDAAAGADANADTPVFTTTAGAPPEDALSRIIRLMDAQPVRYVKGGRVH